MPLSPSKQVDLKSLLGSCHESYICSQPLETNNPSFSFTFDISAELLWLIESYPEPHWERICGNRVQGFSSVVQKKPGMCVGDRRNLKLLCKNTSLLFPWDDNLGFILDKSVKKYTHNDLSKELEKNNWETILKCGNLTTTNIFHYRFISLYKYHFATPINTEVEPTFSLSYFFNCFLEQS